MKSFFTRLPETLFLITIATIPIQLGKHFWPDFASVSGLRIDFLAPTVFFQDFVIVGFTTASFIRFLLTKKLPQKELILALLLFLVAMSISSVFSSRPDLAFWFVAKTFEFAAFAAAITTLNFSKIYPKLVLVFALVALAVTVLSTLQFWQQGSIGFYFLGERNFNLTTPGIAKMDLQGVLMLRPYAAFPHPNVLAGYLAISILLTLFSKIKKIIKISVLPILTFGLILTFSRSAWLGLVFGVIIANLANSGWKKTILWLIIIVAILLFAVSVFPQNPVSERFSQLARSDLHSLVLRTKLTKSAVYMFFSQPLTGVGPGNFLPNLPKFWEFAEDIRFLQPVHNVPLLILAETGFIGVAAFANLLLITFRYITKDLKKNLTFLLPVWVMIILIANLDHYFWTLQQGQVLFWLTLGLTFQKA